MRRSASDQVSYYSSIALHAAAIAGLAVVPAKYFAQETTHFAGRQKAVAISATFVEPQPLSEPTPVEMAPPSAESAERSTIDAAPNSTLAKRSLDIVPNRPDAEIKVELERRVPQAKLAERWEQQKQEPQPEPAVKPLPRKVDTVAAPAAVASQPVALGTSDETPPDLSQNMPPQYPVEAARRGWQGEVLLQLTIERDGSISHVKVVKSSGHAVLDEAAVTAIRRWKASPAKRDGQAIAVDRLLPVRFRG